MSIDLAFNKRKQFYSGYLFIIAGAIFFMSSIASFFMHGKGTPSMWYLRPLRFLIGEEPQKLVKQGIYKLTRNPMYVGVIGIVFGIALVKDSLAVLYYALILFLFFNVIVILIEEPRLKSLHGSTYLDYMKRVPRWFKLF